MDLELNQVYLLQLFPCPGSDPCSNLLLSRLNTALSPLAPDPAGVVSGAVWISRSADVYVGHFWRNRA